MEKTVCVIDHVRVIVLMVITENSFKILLDDPKFVEFVKGFVACFSDHLFL